MTPDRLRTILGALGWSQTGLANRLGVNPLLVRRWASGRVIVPLNVDGWLEFVVTGIETAPLPHGWIMEGKQNARS